MFSQIAKFTKAANADKIKKEPAPMTENEVAFLCRMVISELMELVSTVLPDDSMNEESFLDMCLHDGSDLPKKYSGTNDTEKLAAQLDAIVDLAYYCGDAIKKSTGMPDESLDEVFTEVHKANMNKIHPDGTVHRRSDGKILKPEGWKEPDVVSVIKKLLEKNGQMLKKVEEQVSEAEKVEIPEENHQLA